MKGLIHEGIGVTGEEHIVLCRTPVLQEGVQTLDGAPFSFRGGGMRGHSGVGDIDGSMAQGVVREISGTLKELIRQKSRSAQPSHNATAPTPTHGMKQVHPMGQ